MYSTVTIKMLCYHLFFSGRRIFRWFVPKKACRPERESKTLLIKIGINPQKINYIILYITISALVCLNYSLNREFLEFVLFFTASYLAGLMSIEMRPWSGDRRVIFLALLWHSSSASALKKYMKMG